MPTTPGETTAPTTPTDTRATFGHLRAIGQLAVAFNDGRLSARDLERGRALLSDAEDTMRRALAAVRGESDPGVDGLMSGDAADELAVGSVVRWHRDRTDGGLRTKGADGWTPALALGHARQYELVYAAGGAR